MNDIITVEMSLKALRQAYTNNYIEFTDINNSKLVNTNISTNVFDTEESLIAVRQKHGIRLTNVGYGFLYQTIGEITDIAMNNPNLRSFSFPKDELFNGIYEGFVTEFHGSKLTMLIFILASMADGSLNDVISNMEITTAYSQSIPTNPYIEKENISNESDEFKEWENDIPKYNTNTKKKGIVH